MSGFAPGRTVADRYELLEVIGRGGSSTVYRARDLERACAVAVKVVPLGGAADDDRRRRREVAMLPELRHETLVSVLDQHVDTDAAYVVMELMSDGSLRERMRDGIVPPSDVAAIGVDVAAALHHIHARGIVHRDVKPANILLRLGPRVRAKLTDFGIAKLLGADTATTGLIGTAYYLSPEQATGGAVGPASDIYSLGLTLLEALTGRAAFPGTVAESIGARLLRDPGIPAGLPNGWRSLLGGMTARDPHLRPTAEQVRLRLDSIDREPIADTAQLAVVTLPLAVAAHVAAPSRRPPRRPMTHRARLAVLVTAAAIGLATASTLVAASPASGPGVAEAAAIVTPSASPSPSPSRSVGRAPVTAGAAPTSAPTSARTTISARSMPTTREPVARPTSPTARGRAVGHLKGRGKGATAGNGRKVGGHSGHAKG